MSEHNDDKPLIDQVRGMENSEHGKNNTANILKENRHLSEPLSDEEAKRRMRAYSRRGFIFGGVAALAGYFGWGLVSDDTKRKIYEGAFRFNERVSQFFYRPSRLAPEFAREQISPPRANGMIGIGSELDTAAWRLKVGGLHGRTDDLVLTMDEIRALPRTEMTTELKCIEGWSVIVNWAGVRFSDFAAKYPPKTISGDGPAITGSPEDILPYVSITTPDESYYVGWDMPSIMHPQTLLAYEMNGEPLTPTHGAPLRIASATKYGIKQIKRIGRIEFMAERPRDFWAQPENGYDWYSGH